MLDSASRKMCDLNDFNYIFSAEMRYFKEKKKNVNSLMHNRLMIVYEAA